MSDFNILMDNSKFLLITSKNVNLFQGDNYCDTFAIIVPQYYNDVDLTPFTATLQYVDENMNSYLDILEPEEELYKENYIRYRLPITTKITKSAGKIRLQLSLNWVDKDKLVQYSLHTSEVEVTIHPVSDYYKFSDDSLNKLDQRIGELEAKADYIAQVSEELMKVSSVDDLGFDENGTLHLTTKGDLIGTGVNVAVPGSEDVDDDSYDGIIDADEIYKNVTL